MSVHFRKSCIKVNDVVCKIPTETKWNKTQPHLVVQGYASDMQILEQDGKLIAVLT